MADTNLKMNEWPYSPKFHDFSSFLGLPAAKDSKGIYWRGDERTAKKMEDIYGWGKAKSKSKDHEDVKLSVKKLQGRIGVNWRGKLLVDKLWEYVRMDTQKTQLTKALKMTEIKTTTQKISPKTAIIKPVRIKRWKKH